MGKEINYLRTMNGRDWAAVAAERRGGQVEVLAVVLFPAVLGELPVDRVQKSSAKPPVCGRLFCFRQVLLCLELGFASGLPRQGAMTEMLLRLPRAHSCDPGLTSDRAKFLRRSTEIARRRFQERIFLVPLLMSERHNLVPGERVRLPVESRNRSSAIPTILLTAMNNPKHQSVTVWTCRLLRNAGSFHRPPLCLTVPHLELPTGNHR